VIRGVQEMKIIRMQIKYRRNDENKKCDSIKILKIHGKYIAPDEFQPEKKMQEKVKGM
jgi:hypothetical protein